ncbi:MAG: DUF3634 family protein [Planctomycetes bacterium]|nr:DUF3634 family protein [Planctomycetota bacterium]
MRIFLLLLRFVFVALIVLILWWAIRPRADFTIRIDDREIRIRGRFPEALRGRLIQFLREDVLLRGKMKISARRHRDGYLVLDFQGAVFQEDRQRIRNYLVSVL